MKIHNCIQGTTEWLALRAGIPTASNFEKIVTPKGAKSKQDEKYMYLLLAERLMGHPVEDRGYSHWMDRGSEEEARAVAFYEFQREIETVKVGFITNDADTIGCSPDRLVGDTGLLEIKVPSESVHMGYLLQSGTAYEEYRVQVQGQLWIAEREWEDVLAWHPELPPALTRIERDEQFIGILVEHVAKFSAELEALYADVVARGWVREKPAREATSVHHLPPLEDLLKTARGAMADINAARL